MKPTPQKVALVAVAGCAIAVALGVLLAPAQDRSIAEAQAALDRRDFGVALRLLDARLELNPSDLTARILAAQAARRSADYAQARLHLRSFEAAGGPPLALELEQRLLAVQTGDSEQAALIYSFCQSTPDAPEAPLALEALIVGDLRRFNRPLETPAPLSLDDPPAELKRLLGAADLWLTTRSSTPDQTQGLVWRGVARRLAGDHAGAVADFERAIELDPDHFDARAYLALSIAQDQPLESISHFEKLRERKPDDVRLIYAIATASRSVGDLERARDSLDELLRLQPRNAQVLLERARLALDQRDLDAAKGFLERTATVGPESAELHLVWARYKTMTGDTAAAKVHQEQFQKLDQRQSHANEPRQP